MKKIKLFKRITVCTLVLLLAIPFTAMAEQIQESVETQSPEKVFNPEELEQMLAPIALYPDALLAQVLTAATYPLEVVAANRFVKENQGLKDEALLEAAKDKDWEPSVKAMLGFPDVLAMMDEQLEWTENLGIAFLTQQADCMDAIQRLRQKAYAQGNLDTGEKQVIVVEPETKIIIIEPVSPEVVYVPVYDTTIIYGNWWYPGYPPYSFYPRRYYGTWFFSGFFVGTFWETWYCNWHSRDVYININHYNNFINLHYRKGDDRHFYKDGHDNQPWRHEPRDRKGRGNRDSFKVEQSRSDLPKQNQGTVRLPVNDLKPGLRPTINVSKNDLNNQPDRKKLPEKELKRRTPSSDLREKESKEPSALVDTDVRTSSPRSKVDLRSKQENQRSAKAPSSDLRPSPNDSPRNKDDAQALTEKDRERSRDEINYHLPLNRQIPSSFKAFQGPINRVSR